jgi:hypothetical protein
MFFPGNTRMETGFVSSPRQISIFRNDIAELSLSSQEMEQRTISEVTHVIAEKLFSEISAINGAHMFCLLPTGHNGNSSWHGCVPVVGQEVR